MSKETSNSYAKLFFALNVNYRKQYGIVKMRFYQQSFLLVTSLCMPSAIYIHEIRESVLKLTSVEDNHRSI